VTWYAAVLVDLSSDKVTARLRHRADRGRTNDGSARRHGPENLAGSDQKHHEYVLVLDCTVADGVGDSFDRRALMARKPLVQQGQTLL
jgi:hypothetical protein